MVRRYHIRCAAGEFRPAQLGKPVLSAPQALPEIIQLQG